uniref:Uncharacterized protein n=1 Tax=Caenorhabditis japonica TaxID=281687 RepID=A0A8R1DM58_CAEJA
MVNSQKLAEFCGDSRSQFVFGSSTPRSLAHLDKIPQKQRVYDAKIPKKSATHSDFKAAPIRFNAPLPIPRPIKKEEKRHVITSKDDDIASEPDFVQDREEFMNEMRRHKKELEQKKNLSKSDSKNVLEALSPKEPRQEHVKFAHAPEIAGNAQNAMRIRADTQEEAPVAVENLLANKMNDQIEVSQLMNEITPESVPAVESSDSQKGANVVGDLLAKVQMVAAETTDKAKSTIGDDDVAKVINKAEEVVVKKADQAVKEVKDIKQGIAEKVDDITKSLENSAKSLEEETREKIGAKIENAGKDLKFKVAEAESGIKKTIESTEHKIEEAFSRPSENVL